MNVYMKQRFENISIEMRDTEKKVKVLHVKMKLLQEFSESDTPSKQKYKNKALQIKLI